MRVAGSQLEERLAAAALACSNGLAASPFAQVLAGLGPYSEPAAAFELLTQVTAAHDTGAELLHLRDRFSFGQEENPVERALLMLASQYAAARVPGLPVDDHVKELFAEEFEFFANPPAAWLPRFRHDDVRYREMVRVATLRRFPAGQFHWELTGLPRSWVIKTHRVWTLLRHVVGRMGGFSPLFEFHINARRTNRLLLLEKEANFSYYLAAKSMEKQPAIRGLMLSSWLYCESTAQVSPHLAWLRSVPQDAGALAIDLGPVAEDAGFLVGSRDRRAKYEQGLYRPKLGCVLWPRANLISWAKEHPEFDVTARLARR